MWGETAAFKSFHKVFDLHRRVIATYRQASFVANVVPEQAHDLKFGLTPSRKKRGTPGSLENNIHVHARSLLRCFGESCRVAQNAEAACHRTE